MSSYSPVKEADRIFSLLFDQAERLNLPEEAIACRDAVSFTSSHDQIYFPIPFKETETLAALKGIEGSVAAAIAGLRYGQPAPRNIRVNLERATAFGCQAYMAKVDGLSKLDPKVKKKLKGRHYLARLVVYSFGRYRFARCAVQWIPAHVGQPLQNQERGRVLSYPWLARGYVDIEHDWT